MGDFPIQVLLKVASREVDPDRLDVDRRTLLELAVQAAGSDQAAALLWLDDDGPQGLPELRLSYAHCTQETEDRPHLLRRLGLADRDDAPDLTQDPLTRILGWYRKLHSVDEPQQLWLAVQHVDGDGKVHFIGRLHLLLPEDSTPDRQKLEWVAQVLADTITAERRARPALAVQRFRERVDGENDPARQMAILAQVVQQFTGARQVLLYRPNGAIKGKALAIAGLSGPLNDLRNSKDLMADADSLTFHLFQRGGGYRVCDLNDEDEVRRVCGRLPSATMLNRLHSRIGKVRAWATYTCHVAGVGTDRLGLIQIKLLDKSGPLYQHECFTRTDMAILAALCHHLAVYLPEMQFHQAQTSLAAALGPLSQHNIPDPRRIADNLVSILARFVHGVTALCFAVPNLPAIHSSTGAKLAEIDWRAQTNDYPQPVADNPGQFFLVIRMGYGALLIALNRASIPRHEHGILKLAAEGIVLQFQSLTLYQTSAQNLGEIRHSVRSSLQGVVGHLRTLLDTYERAKAKPEQALTLLMTRPSFGRALDYAGVAATQGMNLVEQSRWAFVPDHKLTLNPKSCSLPLILDDVIRVARIAALARWIKIKTENTLPPDGQDVLCDRDAILLTMNNLVENAIRYGYRHTQIHIELGRDAQFWWVRVTNTGMHIPDRVIHDIFAAHRRHVDRTAITQGLIDNSPGTGLGLFICSRIAKAHSPRAELKVISILDPADPIRAETSFTLTIPHQLFPLSSGRTDKAP